jgi:hypothetical protein
MKKRTRLNHGTTNSAEWIIYEIEYGYQAVIRYQVLIGKWRTKRLVTLTYAGAMKWIEEQV